MISWSYHQTIKDGEEHALERISSISSTIAINTEARRIQRIIDQYPHPDLLTTHTQDAWYYTTHTNLRKSTEANKLEMPSI